MQIRNKITTGVVTSALLIGGSVAYAYWTTTATSGTGTATAAASAQAITLAANSVDTFVPGTSKSVTITASNPNTYKVLVPSLTVTVHTDGVEGSAAYAGAPGCLVSYFSVGSVTPAANPNILAGSASSATVGTVNVTLEDGSNDTSACKGQTITLDVAQA